MNVFDIFRIPSEFGVSLLTLSLILFLSPYFSGVDFGVIKIPKLKIKTKKWLKFVGPILLISAISLFLPFWSRFFSPLKIQNLRISQSDTEYRFEITVQNTNFPGDRLINHIDFFASDTPFLCTSGGSVFNISDDIVIQQVSDNQARILTEMTENQDTLFTYKVAGSFRLGGCGEHIFSLGFDTSIPVPKDSTVQFYVMLPRNLRITNTSNNSNDENDINFLDITKDDVLENYPNVSISIWYAGSKDPANYRKLEIPSPN